MTTAKTPEPVGRVTVQDRGRLRLEGIALTA